MATANEYVQYRIQGPYMNKSVPSAQLLDGHCSDLRGVDGRYTGGLKKFYGMKLVKALTDIDANIIGVTYLQGVTLQKGTGSYVVRGFVVRWGSNTASQKVVFYYYDTETATWDDVEIHASGIGSTTDIDCCTEGKFLYVAVAGSTLKVIYHATTWQVKDAGAGAFYATQPVPAYDNANTATTGGYLTDTASYRVAYRFYDSTRDLYSGLSDPALAYIDKATTNTTCLAQLTIPGGWSTSHPEATFDKLQVFRTINLGDTTQFGGAYYWLDGTYTLATIQLDGYFHAGKLADDVLCTQVRFDPWLDIMTATPNGGAIGRYQGITFAADLITNKAGVGTRYTPSSTASSEYFTDLALYKGTPKDGPPLRYVEAGDSMLILSKGSVVIVTKRGGTLKFTRLHIGRGLIAQHAAHSIGNDAIFLSPLGIVTVDGQQGTMSVMTTLDRQIYGDWSSTLTNVHGGMDGRIAASFFLNTSRKEIVAVWHTTKATTLLEAAPFTACGDGVDPVGGIYHRCFFCDTYGRVVMPDVDETGTGTMNDITAAKTINGTVTGTDVDFIIDSAATFDSSMVNSMLYFTSGILKGTSVQILTVVPGSKLITFATIATKAPVGTTYCISPIVFKATLWPIPTSVQLAEGSGLAVSNMKRTLAVSMALEVKSISTMPAVNNTFRVGWQQAGDTTLRGSEGTIAVSTNVPDSVAYINADGIKLQPYVEQVSAGTKFELTNVEVGIILTHSRNSS